MLQLRHGLGHCENLPTSTVKPGAQKTPKGTNELVETSNALVSGQNMESFGPGLSSAQFCETDNLCDSDINLGVYIYA